jgi:hypothetical protein
VDVTHCLFKLHKRLFDSCLLQIEGEDMYCVEPVSRTQREVPERRMIFIQSVGK